MEENQNQPLFGLSLDNSSKAHLYETARWAKFLAILGFVVMGLMVIMVLFFGAIFGAMAGSFRSPESNAAAGLGAFQFVFLIACLLLYFFPCLFLFHFANKMKKALATDDQETLTTSFQNLKKFFRFIGILMIIFLALYAIVILIALLGIGTSR